ncbi:Dbl homology domain-containing protein [Backusella circina FSU 941]|nr:Dbl homology domain-containing protein [Backusella circina FSU 941]
MQQKHCVLNTFKCSKIFLNIEQIMIANETFLKDLVGKKKNDKGFGAICEKHIESFECYRKYLLEQADAQQLHTKEFKGNHAYRRFLLQVRDRVEFKRKRLQDILVEPVQRISRYSLMLKEILCLTPENHPDYKGLKTACEKAKIIATMADDDPTKIATLFLNLYKSIKDSPCSLINQKRSLITHLDAIEIHSVTNKPTRAVTIFLFTDKILVASRPSIDAKEIDINDLLVSSSNQQQQKTFNSQVKRRDTTLKFKGWADIESMEIFGGPLEHPGSFILSASTPQEIKNGNMDITSFEKYFYKGPRLFSVLRVKRESRHKVNQCLKKTEDFIHQFQMSRSLARQYKFGDRTLHRQWQDIPTYCNVYNRESYIHAKYKNCCALIYVDDDEELEKLFCNNLMFPWIVGLIQPDKKGFRFILLHKPGIEKPLVHTDCEQTLDFESVFWNNRKFIIFKQPIS